MAKSPAIFPAKNGIEIEYQRVNIADVNANIARWLDQHPTPTIPKKRKPLQAFEIGKINTISMKRHGGKLVDMLPKAERLAIYREVEEEQPFIDDPKNPEYLEELKEHERLLNDERFWLFLLSGMISNIEDEKVYSVLLDAEERLALYKAILDISVIQYSAFYSAIVSLDRYYEGEKFTEVMKRRGSEITKDKKRDSTDTVCRDILIRHGIYLEASKLPIPDQVDLVARLYTADMIQLWSTQDARENAKSKNPVSGIAGLVTQKANK